MLVTEIYPTHKINVGNMDKTLFIPNLFRGTSLLSSTLNFIQIGQQMCNVRVEICLPLM
jgi:hypothetical protein